MQLRGRELVRAARPRLRRPAGCLAPGGRRGAGLLPRELLRRRGRQPALGPGPAARVQGPKELYNGAF